MTPNAESAAGIDLQIQSPNSCRTDAKQAGIGEEMPRPGIIGAVDHDRGLENLRCDFEFNILSTPLRWYDQLPA